MLSRAFLCQLTIIQFNHNYFDPVVVCNRSQSLGVASIPTFVLLQIVNRIPEPWMSSSSLKNMSWHALCCVFALRDGSIVVVCCMRTLGGCCSRFREVSYHVKNLDRKPHYDAPERVNSSTLYCVGMATELFTRMTSHPTPYLAIGGIFLSPPSPWGIWQGTAPTRRLDVFVIDCDDFNNSPLVRCLLFAQRFGKWIQPLNFFRIL